MNYDIIIIGGGLSGLAAGIRLAHFGKRVRVFESHRLAGGLNSYYPRPGGFRDVGLHAMTNYAVESDRGALLNRLFRQLRIRREAFDIIPQGSARIVFPDIFLSFTNDFHHLCGQIRDIFPEDYDGFLRLCDAIRDRSYLSGKETAAMQGTARGFMRGFLTDSRLVEMLLMPIMFYGNPQEGDMPLPMFCTMFRSILMEGLCRPRNGMHPVIESLTDRFKEDGGELSLQCAVKRIILNADGTAAGIEDESGEIHTASHIISTIGLPETRILLNGQPIAAPSENSASASRFQPGQIAFCETLFDLDSPPADFGMTDCVVFRSFTREFCFAPPKGAADFSSALFCAPGNYPGNKNGSDAFQLRISHLASPEFWFECDNETYKTEKKRLVSHQRDILEACYPGIQSHILQSETFTPRTIFRYTRRINGAIYGTPQKAYDGAFPPIPNLSVAGTDQGLLGIVGSMISGITEANRMM